MLSPWPPALPVGIGWRLKCESLAAWCLRMNAEASLSHEGQGESLMPPDPRTRLLFFLHVSTGGRNVGGRGGTGV